MGLAGPHAERHAGVADAEIDEPVVPILASQRVPVARAHRDAGSRFGERVAGRGEEQRDHRGRPERVGEYERPRFVGDPEPESTSGSHGLHGSPPTADPSRVALATGGPRPLVHATGSCPVND